MWLIFKSRADKRPKIIEDGHIVRFSTDNNDLTFEVARDGSVRISSHEHDFVHVDRTHWRSNEIFVKAVR